MTKEDAIHILMNPCDFGDHTYSEEKEAQQMAIDALRETKANAERAKLHDNGILAITTSRYDKVRWIVVEDGKHALIVEQAKLDDGTLIVKTSQTDKVKWIVVEDGKRAALFCPSHGAEVEE